MQPSKVDQRDGGFRGVLQQLGFDAWRTLKFGEFVQQPQFAACVELDKKGAAKPFFGSLLFGTFFFVGSNNHGRFVCFTDVHVIFLFYTTS